MVDRINPVVRIKGKNESSRAFRQARADLDKLASLAKAAGVALAAATAAGLAITKQTVEQTRAVRAYSAALGVSTENLSRWGFAAESVGVSGEKVGDIMKDAADKIGDAFRNNAGEAREAIETLGLDIERLAALSPDQQILAIAGALETVDTNAEKVQIMESIGNDLSLLLPLLDDNAERLQAMADEADQLGVTLTSVEAQGIADADRAIRSLDASFASMGQTLTAFVGPRLAEFIDDIAEELPRWLRMADNAVLAFGASIMSLWEAFNPSEVTGRADFQTALEENINFLIDQRNQIARLNQEPLEVGVITGEAQDVAAEARRAQWQIELEELFAFEDAKTRTVREGNIARLQFSTWSSEQQTKHVVGEAVRLTRGVAKESRALFEINKVAGIANAIINTHEGVSKSLAKYPWPLAGIMAGLHAAAGAAEIAAIKSASFGSGGAPSNAGSGGTPSNPIPLPPPAAEGGPPGSSRSTTIIFENVNANTVDDLRRVVVEALEEASDLDEIGDVRFI